MARTITRDMGWTHPKTEEEFRVVVRCTPGSPGRTYGEPGDCYPAEGPDLKVVSVREDKPGGVDRPDLIDLVDAELSGRLGDELAEEIASDEADRYAAAMEDRYDAIREERMCGGRP